MIRPPQTSSTLLDPPKTAISSLVANPFRSSRLRPGVIPYLFTADDSWGQFLQRWESLQFRAAVVGPHGTGKSTLLYQVHKWAESQRWIVHRIQVRPATRWRHGWDFFHAVLWQPPTSLILLDGWEQLPVLIQVLCAIAIRLRCLRLLATSHTSTQFRTVLDSTLSPQRAARVIDTIMLLQAVGTGEKRGSMATVDQLREWLTARSGSVREVMFDLYDRNVI